MERSKLLVSGLALYAMLSLVSMATMSIGAGILGACMLIAFGGPAGFFRELKARLAGAPVVRTYLWLSLALMASCILSLIVGKLWPLSVAGHVSEVHVLRDSAKVWYFLWPLPIWLALSACSLEQRRLVLRIWFGAFYVLCGVAFQQHFTGWPRPEYILTDPSHFHATLFLGHHLSVASVFIFPFFAFLDLTEIPLLGRCAGALAGFVALMLTYSRALWAALPVGLVIWVLPRVRRLKARGFAAIFVLLAVGGAALSQSPGIIEKLRARAMDPEGHAERWLLWEANWRFFEARPLTGVGLKHNQELSGYYLIDKLHATNVFEGHAHNDVLEMLSSTGFLGCLAFLAWWAFLFWVLIRRRGVSGSRDSFAQGMLAAFVVYQINGLTQVNFWDAKVQHQLMWVIAWILLWGSRG